MSKDHFRSNNCCFLKVVRIYARLGSWQNQFLPKVQLALYGYTFWYHDKDSRKRNKSECRLDPNDNTKINERENEAENKRPNWLFLPYCFNCNLFINSLNRFTYRRWFSFLRVSTDDARYLIVIANFIKTVLNTITRVTELNLKSNSSTLNCKYSLVGRASTAKGKVRLLLSRLVWIESSTV